MYPRDPMPSPSEESSQPPEPVVDKATLEHLSLFRWQLRRFLRISEDIAQTAGVTPLHYQLMLHTQGFEGRDWATVGELAERLQAKPHGVAALVTRCEQAGLVRRKASREDRRQVQVHLLAKGRRLLAQLAAQHSAELSSLAHVLAAFREPDEMQPAQTGARPDAPAGRPGWPVRAANGALPHRRPGASG